jgi:hypothetical protein
MVAPNEIVNEVYVQTFTTKGRLVRIATINQESGVRSQESGAPPQGSAREEVEKKPFLGEPCCFRGMRCSFNPANVQTDLNHLRKGPLSALRNPTRY